MAALGAIDATEVRIAETGNVYLAAVGAAAPTDVVTALTSAWTNVGYIEDSGVGITPNVSTTAIKKWQARMPVKYTVDEVSMEVKFMMNQTNRANTSLYNFGAQWVNGAAGLASLTVSSNFTISDLERAMVIEFTSDESTPSVTRFYFARGLVVERDELKLARTTDLKLGITYHVMDNSGTMYKIFTNNADIYSS